MAVETQTRSFEEQVDTLVGLGLAAGEDTSSAALDRARPDAPSSVRCLSCHAISSLSPTSPPAWSVAASPSCSGSSSRPDLDSFVPIDAIELPAGPVYLAVDVDLGAESRNMRPEDALRDILTAGRSPLTIDEEIALILQQPEAIAPQLGLLDGRLAPGDQRVPAFWISEGRPKLGWCWDRNPHTWLGTASCAERIAG